MPQIVRENTPLNIGRLEKSRKARVAGIKRKGISIEWFGKQVEQRVSFTMLQRMQVVVRLLRNQTILNISRPVTKRITDNKVIVTDRSKPGEFPKADRTLLMSTLITNVKVIRKNVIEGMVGTPLDYGVWLETKLDRRFLTRTLNENLGSVRTILTAPFTAGGKGIKAGPFK